MVATTSESECKVRTRVLSKYILARVRQAVGVTVRKRIHYIVKSNSYESRTTKSVVGATGRDRSSVNISTFYTSLILET